MILNEKTFLQIKPTNKNLAYTATEKSIIKNIIISNNTSGNAGATVWIDADGSNANDENVVISAYEYPSKVTSSRDVYIVIEVGGTITLEGTGASVTISGAELI